MSDQTAVAIVQEEYRYTKIEQQGVIRLARLQPSTDIEAGLELSLLHKSLEDCDYDITEHYVALSYVWGDPADTRKVGIEGKTTTITASLDLALRHLRDSSRPFLVWADGICINQNDFDDRNQQVPLMGGIYAAARHTIIFLGPSSKETDYILHHCQTNSPFPPPNLETETGHQTYDSCVDNHILSNKWFTRIWILQEFLLSVDPWLQCGSSRARWDRFCATLHQSNSSENVFRSPENRAMLKSMNTIRDTVRLAGKSEHRIVPNWFQGYELLRLLEIVHQRRGLGVTNARDMVYAHLGLMKMVDGLMVVDYSKSAAQVYEDFCIMNLKTPYMGNFTILNFIEFKELHHRDKDLPSWVPNWMSSCDFLPYGGFDDTNCVLSTNVPHVLGCTGWSKGRVKSFISRSDCSELVAEQIFSATDRRHSSSSDQMSFDKVKQEKLLEWMSNAPQGQETLKTIIQAYSAKMSNLVLNSRPRREILFMASGRTDENFELVYPLLRQLVKSHCLPDFHPDHVKGYSLSALKRASAKFSIHLLITQRFCSSIIELLERIVLSDEKKPIAILDTGEIVDVPLLCRIGDSVIQVPNGASYLILRPSPTSSTEKQKDTILQDLRSTQGLHSHLCSAFSSAFSDASWETYSSSRIRDWNLVAYSHETLNIHYHYGGEFPDDLLYSSSQENVPVRFPILKPDVFAIR